MRFFVNRKKALAPRKTAENDYFTRFCVSSLVSLAMTSSSFVGIIATFTFESGFDKTET